MYKVYKEALLQVYDVGGKLLIGIKSMFVYSLACVGVKCPSGCSMYIWMG